MQLTAATQLGFTVPRTLITNDPAEARTRRFTRAHRQVIYKVLRQTAYELAGRAATIWVEDVVLDDLDANVAGTAHLFQQKVDKVADVRVTVVSDRVFCVRIESADGLLDWRADYSHLSYSVVAPPPGIADGLRAFLNRFGLLFGCFDFAMTRDGTWVWLECNANGQWAWMQEPTGLPMTAAFADLLEWDE